MLAKQGASKTSVLILGCCLPLTYKNFWLRACSEHLYVLMTFTLVLIIQVNWPVFSAGTFVSFTGS